jgi:lipopolysaccharide/colanic/teichoic acid biosynthesis glycosyltransferase
MVKRLFDITMAGIAMVAFLPFGLLIALILKLTGEGEVFYRQERIGLGGRRIAVLKFVTMVKNSPSIGSGLLTAPNDPRVLPFGRFLRKTKLNEVPQLINILLGEMSIIGPRPQAEAHYRLYSAEVRQAIETVRPGLSGIGSVVFHDEERLLVYLGNDPHKAYERDIVGYKGELEVWYAQNHTFWIDLVLMFLTVWVILVPDSRAYRRLFCGLPPNHNPALPV